MDGLPVLLAHADAGFKGSNLHNTHLAEGTITALKRAFVRQTMDEWRLTCGPTLVRSAPIGGCASALRASEPPQQSNIVNLITRNGQTRTQRFAYDPSPR